MDYTINFSALLPYAGEFLRGAAFTAMLSGATVILSFAAAVPGVMARVAQSRAIRSVAKAYVDLVRNTPLLVLLYVLYFGVSSSGWRISAAQSGLIALVVNSTAYVIEIYRAGIAGLPQGQYEAAHALGLGTLKVWRLIIFPQALRIAFPALGNQVVAVVLGSSLVMVISVPDLTFAAFDAGAQTFRYFETFIVAGAVYMVLVQIINGGWRLTGRLVLPRYGS